MLELAVAPNRGYQDPPVSFEHPDHFSDLHSESLTDIGIHGRAAVVCSSAERTAQRAGRTGAPLATSSGVTGRTVALMRLLCGKPFT